MRIGVKNPSTRIWLKIGAKSSPASISHQDPSVSAAHLGDLTPETYSIVSTPRRCYNPRSAPARRICVKSLNCSRKAARLCASCRNRARVLNFSAALQHAGELVVLADLGVLSRNSAISPKASKIFHHLFANVRALHFHRYRPAIAQMSKMYLPSEADAIGFDSKSENAFDILTPSSEVTIFSTSAKPNGSTLSCKRASASR